MPVGGRGQEVSADWKGPTDGFQVTTIRRALERGANESLRRVAGRRGWERGESGRSNRVKTEPEPRSPARGELRAAAEGCYVHFQSRVCYTVARVERIAHTASAPLVHNR